MYTLCFFKCAITCAIKIKVGLIFKVVKYLTEFTKQTIFHNRQFCTIINIYIYIFYRERERDSHPGLIRK